MEGALEILNKINWFLQPIANFIWFLFSKPTGHWLLFAGFAAYLLLPAFDAVRVRILTHKAASNFGSGRTGLLEKIYVFFGTVSKNLGKIITNLPTLLISLLLLILVVAISKGIEGINQFVQNRERIQELKTVLKQLDKRYKVAEMEIIDRNYKGDSTTLQLRFYDASLDDYIEQKQEISLPGSIIYFDAMILNFEYSEIAENDKQNLVIPYRIFSNKLAQNDAVPLKLKDDKGVPYIYKRNNKEVYGIDLRKYNNYIEEFSSFLTDEDAARAAGIRNFNGGNAVHTGRPVRKGQKFIIWVEQTGGIVIKEKRDF